MRLLRSVTSTPQGIVAVAEDGTLWLGVMESDPVSIMWIHLPPPPDGPVHKAKKLRPLPGMVVGTARELTPDDLVKYRSASEGNP